ncbi:serine hydrolase [Nonomuraea sp. NPDC049400]|uniref:serine hydrolase n=1 Tax=Nonomuraea sp. NPDC049400 TaxID=3364352 RepID=UPI0037AD4BEA
MKRRILQPLKLRHTELPGARTDIRGPHAHGYHRYEDAPGQWKVVDVSRQNPTWISAAGDMISTTEDLQTFFSALNSGKLISARLLAEMRKPHPKSDALYGRYGLGGVGTGHGPELRRHRPQPQRQQQWLCGADVQHARRQEDHDCLDHGRGRRSRSSEGVP